ncbi:MAG TPA: DivIVA domain-containing protein [Pseudonocardiaceae bacterium]|jgi:DivIVA domain-containing protein|nr:DivIVA domain-containing protein [Pseudonocardiaceae bacterium]
MPLTPADVRSFTFNKPPVGRPGYHEDEVDDFLDLVEAELIRLIQDNTELRAQVAQLDEQVRALSTDIPANPGPPRPPGPVTTPIRPPITSQPVPDMEHDLRAARVLVLAQERADQLTEQAQATAEQTLSQARSESEQLLTRARDEAEDLIHKARTEAKTILQDARTTAQTVQQQSQDEAASLTEEATRQRTEILDALNHDKTLLESTIDKLRAFELEYRTQLATYLHSLLHQLDGPETASLAEQVHSQQDLVGSGLDKRGQTGH